MSHMFITVKGKFVSIITDTVNLSVDFLEISEVLQKMPYEFYLLYFYISIVLSELKKCAMYCIKSGYLFAELSSYTILSIILHTNMICNIATILKNLRVQERICFGCEHNISMQNR